MSLFRTIGIGTVVEDKEESNNYIKVYLNEITPGITGNIHQITENEYTNTDQSGIVKNIKVSSTGYVIAKWFNIYNSNRLTSPNVVTGEKVMIMKMDGDDEYYWSTISKNTRKKERVIYGYSNRNSTKAVSNDDQDYIIVVDTINKEIVLHTSKNDNEPVGYDMVFNTHYGSYTLEDSNENYLHLDSVDEKGKYSINTNNLIQLNTKNNIINAQELYTLNTKEYVVNSTNMAIHNNSNYAIYTGTFDVIFKGDTLFNIMLDWLQANIDHKGVGNLGEPVPTDGPSTSTYQSIQARIRSVQSGGNGNNGLNFTPPITPTRRKDEQ